MFKAEKKSYYLFHTISQSGNNGRSSAMAYYHKQCDSYFVESHEDQEQRLREESRERDRRENWQTQLAIAENLSQLTSYEYRDDVVRHMEMMEVKRLDAQLLVNFMLTLKFRDKHCPMLPQSIYRQRSNGLCVHTSLTS